jgi:hypothetical protein
MPQRDASERAAYYKQWREKQKALDPDGFIKRSRKASRDSYQAKTPDERKAHYARTRAWNEAWKARDPDGFKAYHVQKAREFALRRRLKARGITLEDYESMLSLSPGCGICKKLPESKYDLRIDHDHATGRVRGLLCNECNIGLGKLGDSIEGLRAALEYLGG